MRRSAHDDLDDEDDFFSAKLRAAKQRLRERVEAVVAAFEVSPAVVTTSRGDRRLIILSGEASAGEQGPLRVSYFDPDGPAGHTSRATVEQLAEEIAKEGFTSVEPVSEDVVIEWTSTPEFEEGTKRSAFVQAINALGWEASQIEDPELRAAARAVSREASDLATTDIEAATEMLQRALANLR